MRVLRSTALTRSLSHEIYTCGICGGLLDNKEVFCSKYCERRHKEGIETLY